MLDIHSFVTINLPDEPLLRFILCNSAFFGGSHIGSNKECLQILLLLVTDKRVEPWVMLLPTSEPKKVVEGMRKNGLKNKHVYADAGFGKNLAEK
jgi:alcohol dehydrogenase (NADP+)